MQELQENDFPKRTKYCSGFLNTFDNKLSDKTYFTEGTRLRVSGFINSQKMRIWSTENPHI